MESIDSNETLLFQAFRQLCEQNLRYDVPSASSVTAAESRLSFRFPMSYLRFLNQIPDRTIQAWDLLRIFPDCGPPGDPFDVVYVNEFNRSGGLPPSLIAFWGNGNGDFDCFDSSVCTNGDEYRIVCWRHDAEIDEPPLRIADSFREWLSEQVRERLRAR